MIKIIIDYSIKNRFMILLFAVFCTAWGVYAAYNIKLDAIPDLSDVQVIVGLLQDDIKYPIMFV